MRKRQDMIPSGMVERGERKRTAAEGPSLATNPTSVSRQSISPASPVTVIVTLPGLSAGAPSLSTGRVLIWNYDVTLVPDANVKMLLFGAVFSSVRK